MAVQQFCLRWNNHQPNFISVFTTLLNNETLVDVTLAAEGQQLQAHKVVLSACSTYFQNLFTANPCTHPIVILKDIKYSDLKIMVDFMYYGEVNVSQDQLPAILKTAEALKVKGLAEMPEQLSLSKSHSQSSDKCDSPGPTSPSVLRRKRFRKSSTGSGSEQTSEETAASGSGSGTTEMVSPLPVKVEPEDSSSLKQELSTESEPRESSVSFEEEIPITRNPSEETSESNIRWPSVEEKPGTSQSNQQGWPLWDSYSYPMNQSQPRRKRSSNPQQDENFKAALEAVRIGGMGFCKAAKLYGVNNRTLWLEYKRRGYPSTRLSTKARAAANQLQQQRIASSLDHGYTIQKIKLPPLPQITPQPPLDFNPPIQHVNEYTAFNNNFSTVDVDKNDMYISEPFLQ